jgi:SDR family mycofactocin-dependent oxidoreductase
MDMSDRLTGKVAFITGAARGQGRAYAHRLAAEGADILALDLAGPLPGVFYPSATKSDLDETAEGVEKLGRRVLTHVGDVRDHDEIAAFVDRGVSEFGRLDMVVANAGICIPAAWNEVTPKMLRDTLDINVTGVWNTVMASAHHLIDGGGGSIVIISSYAGKKVHPFMIPYTTSKHALVGMTRAFAAELGRHRIRVNSVHPGNVATPMGGGDMLPELERAIATHPALGAMGTTFLPDVFMTADAVADAVAFLVSDDSRYITSEHLSVDAGMQYF